MCGWKFMAFEAIITTHQQPFTAHSDVEVITGGDVEGSSDIVALQKISSKWKITSRSKEKKKTLTRIRIYTCVHVVYLGAAT